MYKLLPMAAALAFIAPRLCTAADQTATTAAAPATPDPAALLQQVVQIASQGQTPETAGTVQKFVSDNKDSLTALIQSCISYISQMQGLSGTSADITPDTTASGSGNSASTTPAIASATSQSPGLLKTAAMQSSGTLQTSAVQPSGALQTGHLRGYPSLPNVDPISSVKSLTLEQAAYVQKIKIENLARKQSLMAQQEAQGY